MTEIDTKILADTLIVICRELKISKITIDTAGTGLAIADYIDANSNIIVERVHR